jgi:DNA-binding NarL/FixJ family response regulator
LISPADEPDEQTANQSQSSVILIAEDELAFSAHIRQLLERTMQVPLHFIHSTSGAEVVDSSLASSPDLVIMDLTLPVCDGLTAARKIWTDRPQMKILFWAQQFREIYARELTTIVPAQAVYGFILKSSTDDDLVYAVSSILLHDNSYVDPSVRTALRQCHSAANLSDAEIDTLHHLALGLTDKAIAMRSKISLRGVQNRINSLYKKLLLSDNKILQNERASELINLRTRLTFEAIKRGVIDPESLSKLDKECFDWIAQTL